MIFCLVIGAAVGLMIAAASTNSNYDKGSSKQTRATVRDKRLAKQRERK